MDVLVARSGLSGLLTVACALFLCGSLDAAAQPFEAQLSGAAAQPPNASVATGHARLVFDETSATLLIELRFTGLSSPSAVARVHCCAPPPASAPVALQSPGLDGFPRGVVGGNHAVMLDLRDPASFDPAFVASHGGTPNGAVAALSSGLAAGTAYVEVTSVGLPTGEIRGYSQPALVLFGNGMETPAAFASLLRCDAPDNASLVDVAPGAALAMSGTAIGVSDLSVNGQSVPAMPDRRFTANVTGRHGVQFVEISGIDGAGAPRSRLCSVLGASRWIAEDSPFDEALRFRFEPSGFQKLTSRLSVWFAGPMLQQTVAEQLSAANPLYTASCGQFSVCVTQVRYVSLTTSPESVVASIADANTLVATAEIDAVLRLHVTYRELGIPGSVTSDVRFENAQLKTEIEFDDLPSARLGLPTFQAGTVTDEFTTMSQQLRDQVKQIATEQLLPRLSDVGAPGSANLFVGLMNGRSSTLPVDLAVPRLTGDAAVPIGFGQRQFVSLVNGGLSIDTGLYVANPLPDAGGRIAVPLAVPPSPRSSDVHSAVHLALINQILQAVWRAGAFDGALDADAELGATPGTELLLDLRLPPIVTGVDVGGKATLDVGALDLVVRHPALPDPLRVTAGARISARASMLSGDLVFGDFVVDEQRASTGAIALDTASMTTLDALLDALFVRIADAALNDTLPVLPATVFTIPDSLAPYGFTPGTRLIHAEQPAYTPEYFYLDGLLD